MEILSVCNLFPLRVETKIAGSLIVFVDIFSKKVYNIHGSEVPDELSSQVLERISTPKSVI